MNFFPSALSLSCCLLWVSGRISFATVPTTGASHSQNPSYTLSPDVNSTLHIPAADNATSAKKNVCINREVCEMYNLTIMDCYQIYIIACQHSFNISMYSMDKESWCTWNRINSIYNQFTVCTEDVSSCFNIHWPNKIIEAFFIEIHQEYFRDCDFFREYKDPPQEVMLALMLTPICIIPLMVGIVVWKTKNEYSSS
uniref:Receptor (G protein-coupled) activity modifying protein 2 n=1 Tax=Erpetoichthys calabaricus TaxID=27687 RepID=A0A8C4SK14_ERPCA